jgi:hypothetical protein
MGTANTVVQTTSYSSSNYSYNLIIDSPSLITPKINSSTTNFTPSVSGSSAPSVLLELTITNSDGSGNIYYTNSDSSGNWTLDVTTIIPNGTYTIIAKDTINNKSSTPYTLTILSLLPTTNVLDISLTNTSQNNSLVTTVSTQNIIATLSNNLLQGEILFGSTNNGQTFTNITNYVSGTNVNWLNASLVSGYYDAPTNSQLNSIKMYVANNNGNGITTSLQYLFSLVVNDNSYKFLFSNKKLYLPDNF